ncbi:MAG: hypothetical protein ACI92B_001709 [Marinobacter maritimus]|jgi:hypothetical protein
MRRYGYESERKNGRSKVLGFCGYRKKNGKNRSAVMYSARTRTTFHVIPDFPWLTPACSFRLWLILSASSLCQRSVLACHP